MTKNSPPFLKNNPVDISISTLVGLETYKALYAKWPSLYSYISDPLNPTFYYSNLVDGVVASSGLDYEICGQTIYNSLSNIVGGAVNSDINNNLVSPLLQSSYKVDNLNDTFWGTAIWVIIVTFLAFYILIYLYIIGFWNFFFGSDGIACYDCKSIFDNLIF
jgi:hypothetical protein